MIVALYGLSLFLSNFAPVTNRLFLWLAIDMMVLTFAIGFILAMGVINLRRIAEVFILFIIWSLVIPVPLQEDFHSIVVSLWGLFLVVCYTAYTRRTRSRERSR